MRKCFAIVFFLFALTAHAQDPNGSSSVNAYNLNNFLYVDGIKYATLASAFAALPAAGGTVFDCFPETWNSDPFVAMAKPFKLVFCNNISVQWITNVPLAIRNNGQIISGGGPNGTQIAAGPSFPINSYILSMGLPYPGIYGSRVEDIAISCGLAPVVGCGAVNFDGVQELSGELRIQGVNCTGTLGCIRISSDQGAGATQDALTFQGLGGIMFTGTNQSCVGPVIEIAAGVVSKINVQDVTAIGVVGGCGGPQTPAGIQMDSPFEANLAGIHGEQVTSVILSNTTANIQITQVTGHTSTPNVFTNTAVGGNWNVNDLFASGCTNNTLNDTGDSLFSACPANVTFETRSGVSSPSTFGTVPTIGWVQTVPNGAGVGFSQRLLAGFTPSSKAIGLFDTNGTDLNFAILNDGRFQSRGGQAAAFSQVYGNSLLTANRTTTFSDISGFAMTEASAVAANTILKALDSTHASSTASGITDNGTTVATTETVNALGPFNCKNFENTQCVDGANSQGWAGADICAWMNSAIGALSAAGGDLYVSAPAATTCNTTTVDGGTKKVFFHFGQMLTTCNVQCIHVTSNGSSIRGLGDATEFIAAAGLPALTPMIFFDGNAAGGNYDHTIAGLYLLNGRDSNVGMLQLLHEVRSNVSDIFADGGTVGFYRSIGVESQDGFSESFRNIRCNNAASAICVGVTAPTMNMSNETVQDVLASNMTAVALNYATTGQPTLTDTTQILNASGTTAGGGQKAQQGVTTVNGAQLVGITSFPVVSGAACFIGYQAWIGLPFDAEWNVVTNVVANTLTLMFPTRQAHSNGERVLCGNVGIEVGQNTTNTFIATPHLEGYGTSIDCHDCQEITILTPNLGISPAESPSFTVVFANGSPIITAANSFVSGQAVSLTTSGTLPVNFATGTSYYVSATGLTGAQFELSATRGGGVITAGSAGTGTQTVNPTTGDGIRFDSVLQATVTSPHLNGFFNTINLTNRVPPWGSAAGVNVIGYTVESSIPGDTNEGLQNNTGIDLNRYGNGCSNTYPTFNFTPLNCPSYQGQTGAVNFVCRSTQPFVAIGSTTVYCNSGTNTLNVIQNGNTAAGQVALTPNLFINSNNTPTVSSGFGTTPTVPSTNSTVAFTVNVGTGGVATSGVVAINGPTTGWNCHVDDITTTSSAVFMTKQTASTSTTVTVGNFTNTGATGPWASGDVLQFICAGR